MRLSFSIVIIRQHNSSSHTQFDKPTTQPFPNMKISLVTVTALVAASAPTAMAADWKCNGSWNDGGLKRLSFKFQGYCEDRSGQCFLSAIRGKGLTVHNWQAWKTDDNGWWQVDLSTTAG